MAMEIDKLIHSCKEFLEEQEIGAGAGMKKGQRRPDQPILFIFLGKHSPEARSALKYTVKQCWPQDYTSVGYREYLTPEDYQRALDYDANRQIDLEEAVIKVCSDRHFAHANSVQLVYLLSLDGEEDDEGPKGFIRLLTEGFEPPLGDVETRYVFAFYHCTRRSEQVLGSERLRFLKEQAKEETWKTSYVISLGNRQFSAAGMTEEAFLEGYALAAEMMMILNSVHMDGDPILRLPKASDSFITGAIRHIEKPTDEIARSVLWQYLETCQDCCARNVQTGGDELAELTQFCGKMLDDFYRVRIAPQFPSAGELEGLPNGAVRESDVGLSGVGDRTYGIYQAYVQKHFVDAVLRACGSMEELGSYFADTLAGKYNCAKVQQLFGGLTQRLRNGPDPLQFSKETAEGLYARADQEAKDAFLSLAYDALRSAVEQMRNEAQKFAELLSEVQGSIGMAEEEITNYYLPVTRRYLDGQDAGQTNIGLELGRSCSEEKLGARMQQFFEEMVTAEPVMRLSFEAELSERLGAANAQTIVVSMLNLQPTEMQDSARMYAQPLTLIEDVVLLNPGVAFAKKINGSQFSVPRTDRVDHVAFYSFDADQIIRPKGGS